MHDTLVRMVNDYGEQRKVTNMPAKWRSLIATWEDTNSSEMWKFFAVVTQMGIDKCPSVKKYFFWRSEYNTPWFGSMFSRDRFELIYHSMLHACELDAEKVQKILEPFRLDLQVQFRKMRKDYNKLISKKQRLFKEEGVTD